MKDELSGLLRNLQIIVVALAAGVLVFLVIIVFFLGTGMQPLDPGAVISLTMVALAFACVLARFIVPGLAVSSARQTIAQGTWKPSVNQPNIPVPDTDEGKLAAVFMTKTILGSAMLEGAAFGNLVAYMLDGQVYSLVLGIVFMLAILVTFPTRDGLEQWIDQQMRRVKEIRDMPRSL